MREQYSLVKFLVTTPDNRVEHWTVPVVFYDIPPPSVLDVMEFRHPDHLFKVIDMLDSTPEQHKEVAQKGGKRAITYDEIVAVDRLKPD
ncbi:MULTISPECIES: hypothetical protein [Larkinella]|jgi:hypothetical protein|uniref:Uncharacterized protein n=1 Tax=Larkinella humicola TaxID=2607654 RepID=A0A5N1JLX3_9BACT|nr:MULTISPECIES: hypothetical protein [Larkinella]KAA9356868.1 hypothetical protein F0P93_03765 [Larkinella humicola]